MTALKSCSLICPNPGLAKSTWKAAKRKGTMLALKTTVGTMIISIILAMLLFWLLPELNVDIPLAIKIVIMCVFPFWSVLTYIPRKRALSKKVTSPSEAMVGKTGITLSRLDPEGTVRINYEVWSAVSHGDTIEEGSRIEVLGVDGLVLTVRKEEANG